jgi:hypothetical protein
VEALAVLDLVAVDELLVAEDVAVGMDDALREPGRPRRVVELGGILGRSVARDGVGRCARERVGLHDEHRHTRVGEARRVVRVRDHELRARVREAMPNRVVAVQDRHREQDSAQLPDAEEDRRGLGRRRQHDRDAVAALDAEVAEDVRRLVRQVLELAPRELAIGAVEALPHHRQLVARVLVADVGRDVVARRHLPSMRRADLLVRG